MLDKQTSFGPWLKQQRRRRGLTQEVLSGLAGVSASYLRKIEAGERQPTRLVVKKLLEALRVPSPVCDEILQEFSGPPQSGSNIPKPVTALIGREHEVEAITTLLRRGDTRLVTLSGVGGVGKTRLAIEVALELADEFTHGVAFVDLTPIHDVELVVSTIAQAVGVREAGERPVLDLLKGYLRQRRLLLVLDNFEQIVAAAPVVNELLMPAVGVKALVTSRELLRVRGERVFDVPPLALPDDSRPLSVHTLIEYDAIKLFIERAREVNGAFDVDEANVGTIVAICRKLDGLPLAIELAASWVRIFSPSALLHRLDDRLQALTGGARDLPVRQKTLRSAIAWSYDLLSECERELFRQLAVFVGGFTLEAAEAVVIPNDHMPPAIADRLRSLVDKSLVHASVPLGTHIRFRMLETVREYAMQELAKSGETDTVYTQYVEYFLDLARRAGPELKGLNQVDWFDQLRNETGNLQAVLSWLSVHDRPARLLALANDLWWYWAVTGRVSEGFGWFDSTLRSPGAEDVSPLLLASAFNAAGALALRRFELDMAGAYFERAISLQHDVGDCFPIADAIANKGLLARYRGDYARARLLFEESLRLFQKIGDDRGSSWPLRALGEMAREHGEYDLSHKLLEQALAIDKNSGNLVDAAACLNGLAHIARVRRDFASSEALYTRALEIQKRLGDTDGLSATFQSLGVLTLSSRDPSHATRHFQQALALAEQVGDQRRIADSHDHLGQAVLALGQYETSASHHRQALRLRRDIGHWRGVVWSLDGLAQCADAIGQLQRASRLLGAADSIERTLNLARNPRADAPRQHHVVALVEVLGVERFEQYWREGQAMTRERAVAYALEEP